MNEWLKKVAGQLKALWTKWTVVQKLVVVGIALGAVILVVVGISLSGQPTTIRLLSAPVKAEDEARRIGAALEAEGIPFELTQEGYFLVKDEKTAKRAKTVLIREDLIPKGTSPWDVFDMNEWAADQFTKDVNLRRAITESVKLHIESIADISKASVEVVIPKDRLFADEQNPVTASVIVFPKPGSDFAANRKKIEGVEKIVMMAVEGLLRENVVIADQNGMVLNDFSGLLATDRLDLVKKEQKFIQALEAKYRSDVLRSLQSTYTEERVRDINVKFDMDMSKKSITSREFKPFVVKPDDPETPYDDSIVRESVTRSESVTEYSYQGTGFNPQGPAGAEGQTPPAYQDMQNMNGKATQTSTQRNYEIGETNTVEEYSPKIDRVTVSVNIDGVWKRVTDSAGTPKVREDGTIERTYIPLSPEEIKAAEALIRDAIGFDSARGDSVTVRNIQFDRSEQFRREDEEFIRAQQFNLILVWSLVALATLMVGFILYKIVAREFERRRRIAEEKRALEQQMLRENAIRQAEEQNIEVSMSVEERKRLELQESAINMAKEHPEDVAQLIRTWLREE